MQIEQSILIDELRLLLKKSSEQVKKFQSLKEQELNFKNNPDSWSILECLEHLNLYGDFYLPEIEKQLQKSNRNEKSVVFKSGLLGNYFANLMRTNKGKIKKMKSPKDKNPMHSHLSTSTIERCLKQFNKLDSLLQQATFIDLNKTKTAISISKLIRLKLGDTFRFLCYHIERHVQQAERMVKND